MTEERFEFKLKVNFIDEETGEEIYHKVLIDNSNGNEIGFDDMEDLLNEQQELIEELQVSDEMGWKRAERFEKKCPKELHNKKMYIKRLEYKVQKFKEENEQLRMKLKGEDYIMVSEMLSNLRKTGICDGCKNKDKPVEWYLERGFSITGQICDRYEPEV